jgi:hypothetical protein
MFVVGKGGGFPGGSHGHEAVDARLDLFFHELGQIVVGDGLLAEGRYEGGDGAGEGALFHAVG